jgi:CubicO group peptidase (beta-lactamase class C family)
MKNLMSVLTLLIIILLLGSCNQSFKETTPEKAGMSGDTLELAAQKIEAYIESGKLAGISIMVVKDAMVVQRENFGYANIDNQQAIEDNTIFRIYSMTKPVTAVALMTLFDEGKFELDDKVSKYIPEFEYMMVYNKDADHYLDFQEEEMSIRNLLTHTSGIPYGWSPNSFVDSCYRANNIMNWDSTIAYKVKQMSELPLKFQPGSRWDYGLSIDVAGYLVEVLSGEPLDAYFKSRIFDPLKMDDSGFFCPEEKHARLAEVYTRTREAELVQGTNIDNDVFRKPVTAFLGGAGMVSTIDDYARFCQMMINGGELDGVRILEESTVALIMSDQLPEGASYMGDDMGYGLAGQVNIESGEYSWSGAATTSFWIDPANNMIVLAFAQLMPSNYSAASEYRKIVGHSIVE